MKVKKYQAASMPEAMQQIRQDLGDQAVILNSKEVQKGGFLGLFSKRHLEVVAASDTDPLPVQSKSDVRIDPESLESHGMNMEERQPLEEVSQEVRSLKEDIQRLNEGRSEYAYPPLLEEMNQRLIEQEVAPSIRKQLMKHLLKQWYQSDETLHRKDIKESLHTLLTKEWLPESFKTVTYEKKFLHLVGPTGVGKTTTLAKIASKAMLEDGKRIAFITADTYRIAAIDQLKTYAKILNVPLEVAYSMEDFKKAKEKFADRDLILVDSAGRNFRKSSYVKELTETIPFEEDSETYLVLSLTSKYKDMLEIHRKFSGLSIDHLIFTKIDETTSFGAAINFCIDKAVTPAYFANGQNVPDDLIEATPPFLVKTMLEVATDE